jgi:hypothetical protein
MHSRTMPLSFLTPFSATIPQVTGAGILAFVLGDAAGGVSGGVIGAICGAVVFLIGQLLSHLRQTRLQHTNSAIQLDQERDKLMDRANEVHEAAVAFLREKMASSEALHGREAAFLRDQVRYHEQLDLTARERLHALVGEVQRCCAHIRKTEEFIALTSKAMPDGTVVPDKFVQKNYDEIVALYPLPSAPTTPAR